jgi:hypothetical protein
LTGQSRNFNGDLSIYRKSRENRLPFIDIGMGALTRGTRWSMSSKCRAFAVRNVSSTLRTPPAARIGRLHSIPPSPCRYWPAPGQ